MTLDSGFMSTRINGEIIILDGRMRLLTLLKISATVKILVDGKEVVVTLDENDNITEVIK